MRRLAALLLLGALVAGCGGGAKKSTISVEQIVSGSTAKTAAVKSFHFVLTVEHPPPSSGLSLASAEGDVAVPDRVRADASGTFAGIPLKSELVFVGDRHFFKDPLTQRWRTLDVKTNPIAFFNPAKGVLAVVKQARGLVDDGSETVGGADCYRLKGTVPASALAAFLGTTPSALSVPVELWIGKRDLLLRQVRASGPAAPGEAKDVSRTVSVSRFDEHVTISVPSGQ